MQEAATPAAPEATPATEVPAAVADPVAAEIAPAKETVAAEVATATTAEAAGVAGSEAATKEPVPESEAEAGPPESETEEIPSTSGIDAELLALEEELAQLEREEQARKEVEAAQVLDVSSDDLWQVDTGPETKSADDSSGAIRFAEDIAGFRETDAGRRGGRRGGSSARNRRRR